MLLAVRVDEVAAEDERICVLGPVSRRKRIKERVVDPARPTGHGRLDSRRPRLGLPLAPETQLGPPFGTSQRLQIGTGSPKELPLVQPSSVPGDLGCLRDGGLPARVKQLDDAYPIVHGSRA